MKKGQRVKYIPRYAHGDPSHPHCETGVVKRADLEHGSAWVLYDNGECVMRTGDEPYTAQSTRIVDLVEI